MTLRLDLSIRIDDTTFEESHDQLGLRLIGIGAVIRAGRVPTKFDPGVVVEHLSVADMADELRPVTVDEVRRMHEEDDA